MFSQGDGRILTELNILWDPVTSSQVLAEDVSRRFRNSQQVSLDCEVPDLECAFALCSALLRLVQ